ncbi:MAG: metallophosphoesterase [Acidobacteriota bacterium]
MFKKLILIISAGVALAQVQPPVGKDSLRFAVIGDSGTGDPPAIHIGSRLAESRATFPFDFAVMMGDNIYGGETAKDCQRKFETPYKALLDAGVKFYASLGNHDQPTQINYKNFNMNGQRYYTFRPRAGVRFFALDSNYMDARQLSWLENALKDSGSDWKICFFHHPLYSSGERHGPDVSLRAVLEPLFVKYQVSVVLTGHEHFYERIKPQSGITYFIVGSSAKLRKDGIERTETMAAGNARDRSFMLMEVAGDELHFQAANQDLKVFDSGTIHRAVEVRDSQHTSSAK